MRYAYAAVEQELDGTEGGACHRTLTFLQQLHATGALLPSLPFLLTDERFSTVQAHAGLQALRTPRKRIAQLHDQWAAAEILARYLEWGASKGLSSLDDEDAEVARFQAQWNSADWTRPR